MPLKSPVEKCIWFPFSDEPLLKPAFRATRRYSNPFLILPDSSCDGRWHLFCDSWLGIHHFVSDSGIVWNASGIIEYGGKAPSVMRDGESFCLVYEKTAPQRKEKGEDKERKGFFSRIEMRISTDLVTWSKPRIILDAKDVPLAADPFGKPRVCNPQILRFGDIYRLYFTTSSVKVQGRILPRHLACVSSDSPTGPYAMSEDAVPLMTVMPDDKYSNLSVGRIRLVKTDTCVYAFQCPVYWDAEAHSLSSAILLLRSDEGTAFSRISDKPMLVPASSGWASGSITSCDAVYKDDENCWYCWFSASDGKKGLLCNENIGLMIGNSPGE